MGFRSLTLLTTQLSLMAIAMVLFSVGPVRAIDGVFTSFDVVLDGATITFTSLAAGFTKPGSPLREGHHADTGLLPLLTVLALSAAVLVSVAVLGAVLSR